MPVQTRMSKASLFSLIFGILGCIPFLTGALAMLLGLIGFVKTGKPGVSGRWMAVIGGLLGTASVVVWTLFFGSITAFILALIGLTEPPRAATRDFIRELSTAPLAQVAANNPGYSEESLKALQEYVQNQGTFIDTTFPVTTLGEHSAHVEGTAQFTRGVQRVTADLEEAGGKWRVTEISIRP
jgi:hypothetical protein